MSRLNNMNVLSLSILLLLSVLSISCKKNLIKNMNKLQAATKHTVLLLGDVGQFQIYQKNLKSKIFNLDKTDESIDEICDDFLAKNSDKMMLNFERLIPHIRKLGGVDESVLLGDMIYPEVKGLGVATGENKAKNKEGLAYEEQRDEYKYRLYCGWKYFINLVKDKKNPKFMREDMGVIFGNHSYDVDYKTEAEFISQSFDSAGWFPSSDGKVKFVPNPTRRQLLAPFVTKGKSKDIKIFYLNVDPSLLLCANFLYYETPKGELKVYENAGDLKSQEKAFKDFKGCLNGKYFTAYPEVEWITSRKINKYIRYLRELILLLDNLNKLGSKPDWKIARMHQPIFNPEFDFLGMKLCKPLMKAFRDAGIHLFFVSHNHTAQFGFGLYEDANYKYMIRRDIIAGKFEPRTDEPSDEIKKADDVRPFSECIGDEDQYYDEHNKIDEKKKISPSCVNRAAVYLKSYALKDGVPTGKIYINRDNHDVVLQILNGNGGRVFDPLFSDRFSDFKMLWGYTGFDRHGYTTVDFVKDKDGNSAVITYFALESEKADAKVKPLFAIEVEQLEGKEEIKDRTKLLEKSFKVDMVKKLQDKFRDN